MDEDRSQERKRIWFIWGMVLAWAPCVALIFGMILHYSQGISEPKATGLGAVAAGIAETYVHYPGGSDCPFGQVVLFRAWDTCPVRGARHLLERTVALPLRPGRVDVFRLPTASWSESSIGPKPRQCVKCRSRIPRGEVSNSAWSGRGFFVRFGSRILRAWGEQKPHEDAAFWVCMH